jgi:predicted ATPase
VTANVALVDRLLSVAELQAAVAIATSRDGRGPWSGRGRWIVVFAAHNGAGASTVALALADRCRLRRHGGTADRSRQAGRSRV